MRGLPSYLKIATVLRDSDDKTKWAAREVGTIVFKTLTEHRQTQVHRIPRVVQFRTTYPTFR
jgi:hypothetical protein